MIISEIHIDGFGIFNGFSIKNLDKGINILLGENEAGKSTLLKFFKFTLFGYPRLLIHRMPPVNGGSHGGRIKAILSTNSEVVFERKGDDKISLFYEGNTSKNETQWLQFLGNATKDIYENVFAFSLDELLSINSLSVSGVEDKIFSIGSGMGNISIGQVISDIQDATDQIYSQRGSKQVIPTIYKSIQDIKSEIKIIQENLPRYQELTAAIHDLTKEISDLENNLNLDRNRKRKLEDYLKCYASFVSVIKDDELLTGLPEPQDYLKEGPEKLNELENEEKGLNAMIEELQKGSSTDKGIEEIEEELKSISFNSEILAEKANINYLKTNLEKYKQTIGDRLEDRGKIDDLDNAILEKLKSINSLWTRQNIIAFTNIITHQDRVKTFKEDLDRLKRERIELKGRKQGMLANSSRIDPGNLFILISLIFLLGSFLAFYYSLYAFAIICFAISLLVFLGRRYLIKENPVVKIDEELSEAGNREKEMQESYSNYLEEELNLERTLSADTVLEILSTVTQLKKDIGERDDLERKQKDTRDPYINDFEYRVESIGNLLRSKEDDTGIEFLFGQIAEEFDFAESQSKKQEELQDSLSQKKKNLEKSRKKLNENNLAILDLLNSVNTSNRDDFRKKYEDNNKILKLKEERRTAINTIETIAGINMADDVINFLKSHDQAGLKEDVANLGANIELTSGVLNSKNTELGEMKGEIKRIEGKSELAEKMTQLETEKQKLTEAYKEWMTGKIALKILTGVREKYEKEKQPVIIQSSGRYFKKITGGRYERIHAALDKSEITVFDLREASKTIDQLSRGTREQLLVSLRLGFIEEYETNAEPLPVVVDDIFVNFDPKRAQKTAEIFREFGINRQVIIFTCHPSTKDYFNKSPVNIIELKQ